jgi:hypothetical protein
LLDAWASAGIQPKNMAKENAFPDAWRKLAGSRRLLDVYGRPTQHLKPELHQALISRVATRTDDWMIGGILDVPADQLRTSVVGTQATEHLQQLAVSDRPFFLRVSFYAPHVACHISRSHLVDPDTIDLPLPTPEERAGKSRFEREQIRTHAGGSTWIASR